MNTIMVVLVCLLGICLAAVAYVLLRNRIVFLIGIRNIPRRVAQTVLIVIGLMLSTLIISAAFGTGDTVDYSISNQAYTILGHVDETIQPGTLNDNASSLGDSGLDVPADQYLKFQSALQKSNNPDIDGSIGVRFEPVPVINPSSRQSEPVVTFAGLDSDHLANFPDIISAASGELLDVSTLKPDEAYMNKSAAGKLDTKPGDTVHVWVNNQQHDFKILDIVEDRVLTGVATQDNQEGMVTRLDTLHSLFGHDRLSFIAVSNTGGVRDTVGLTDSVENDLRNLIRSNNLKLTLGDSKDDGIRTAEEIGNFMATFFLLLGLFSIGAGMLLIIMIFVMLAAERKSEMGMARAVGMKRSHLVQMFMSEGTTYNLVAAMVGAGLGILVAMGMAYIMSAIFASSDFALSIEPHFTPRSLIIAYSLGVVLTFITVTFASWRVSNLNIVAAIRGTAEDRRSEQRGKTDWRWTALSLPAMALPPLGLWMLFRKGLGYRWSWFWIAVSIPAMIIPPLGLWLLLRNGFGIPSHWLVSVGGLVLGALLFVLGVRGDAAFPFALGFSLMAAGAARLLTLFRLPDRPVYTTAGVLLLLMWGLTAGNRLEAIFGPLSGGIEMFFLSGIAMVTASTFILIYNADLILAGVTRIGGLFGSILPAVKTAVAYPLDNRFRTGMTLAMISLVVFSLTMMSTMNLNFQKVFLQDSARGGWDVVVRTNSNNPIPDLPAALRSAGSNVEDGFRTVGRLSAGSGASSTETRQDPQAYYDDYPILGMDRTFMADGHIPLEHRARGFESDDAVWQAVRTRDDVALIDSFAVRSGGFGDNGPYDFKVKGIKEGEELFDPVTLEIHDPASNRARKVELIGVLGTGASANFFGMYVPEQTFRDVYGEPRKSVHYVALKEPGESKAVAKEIEATLLTSGVQADSLKEIADDQQSLQRNFFYLMQAFMALGLFVGIAAVGVIAFRTVVERRQQIGMLRAIGYKHSTVAVSFLLESSFVTLLAIFSGITLAIWLSYFLLGSEDFPTHNAAYHVPWLQILLFAAFTFLASLVMTWIPARQAASIPTAEALRYE